MINAAYNMLTERPDPKSIHESLIGGGWHLYNPHTHSMHPYAYSKNPQNLAVRRIAAEAAADTELEVNAVCPGGCATGMNPGGTDTPRKCIETILWLALGRRNSSLGGRVHGGFFRYMSPAKGSRSVWCMLCKAPACCLLCFGWYMKQISFELEDGTDLMAAGVPDDGMRSWWDGIGESESGWNAT